MFTCVQFFLNFRLYSLSVQCTQCYIVIKTTGGLFTRKYIDIRIYIYLNIIHLYFVDNFSVCFNAKIKNVPKSNNSVKFSELKSCN